MITPEDRQWVDERFRWMFEQFGKELFDKNHLHLEPFEGFHEGFFPQEAPEIWELTQRICTTMDIDPGRILLSLEEGGASYDIGNTPLGTYIRHFDFEQGKTGSIITYISYMHQSPYAPTATLAHELAHVKLLGEGRISQKSEEHEYLTDLCTVFFGYGLVECNSYYEKNEIYLDGTSYSTVYQGGGYLSPEIWAYALALYCRLKGLEFASYAEYVDRFHVKMVQDSIKLLEKEGTILDEFIPPAQGVAPDFSGRGFVSDKVKNKLEQLDKEVGIDGNPENRLKRAKCSIRYRIFEQAVEDLYILSQTAGYEDHAWLQMAKAWALLGNQEKAIELLERTQPRLGHTAAWLFAHASLVWDSGDEEQVRIIIDQALEVDAECDEAWWYKAHLLNRQNDTEGALHAIEKALAIAPDDEDYWNTKGIIFSSMGKSEMAKKHFQKALELEPYIAEAHLYLGIKDRKENNFDQALVHLQEAVYHSYSNQNYIWHRDLALRREVAHELDDWMPISPLASPDDAFNIRMQLRDMNIKAKFKELEGGMLFTDVADQVEWLWVRDSDAEAAINLLETSEF